MFKRLLRDTYCRRVYSKRFLTTNDNDHDMSIKEYWNKFYTKHSHGSFEWLIKYDDDSKLIENLNLNLNTELMLDIGCGTSVFSSQLCYHLSQRTKPFLICADFSFDCLSILKRTHSDSKIGVDYVLVDSNHPLPFRFDIFDFILDKGYLDSILKSKTNPIQKSIQSMFYLFHTLDYSFFKDKILLQITDEVPELRLDLFDKFFMRFGNELEFGYFYKEIQIDDNYTIYVYFLYKQK